ncbi:hypothetical protein [uncultured Tateyamaria sp.]|uniref:hypothetical protein n=1 Tax=Tateyamaria sp. 1078 TaxID=3417464 RepID=UPI0026193FBC|nr:hypothetical protein [uncultured Tateyamaria sp.]
MRRIFHNMALGIAASGLATATFAQGYNAFVIDLPYAFSVPSAFTSVAIHCTVSGQNPNDDFNFERAFLLENGQARGTLQLGYSNLGPTDDFVLLTAEQTDILRRITSQRGFALNLRCNVKEFQHETAGQMFVFGDSSSPAIAAGWTAGASAKEQGRYYLDPAVTVTRFSATFGAEDNTARASTTGQTATASVPTVSPGLQSLQTILQGE